MTNRIDGGARGTGLSKWPWSFLLPALLACLAGQLVAAGCAKKKSADAVREHQARYDQFRAEMLQLVKERPVGAVVEPSGKLEPEAVYSRLDSSPEGNTAILMLQELEDPSFDPESGRNHVLGLSYSDLRTVLQYASPRAEFERYDEHLGGEVVAQRLAEGLDFRYLIVARVNRYVPPTMNIGERVDRGDLAATREALANEALLTQQGKLGFFPGVLELDVFFVDRERKQILAQFPVQATGADEVTTVGNVEQGLENDLWASGEGAVMDGLTQRVLLRTVE